MIDPRRRALEQIASGMLPDTSEVDVDEIRVPAQRLAMPAGLADDAPVTLESLTPPQMATERDYYGEALEAQRRARLGSTIEGFGSGIIEAITGVGPSGEQIQARKDRVAEPMAQYLMRQKRQDEQRKMEIAGLKASRTPAGKPILSSDASSPESKKAQERNAPLVGDQLTPEEIARVPESAWPSVLEQVAKKRTAEVTREGHVSADKRSQASLLQGAKQHAEEMGFKWENMSHTDQRAAMALEAARIYRDQARADQLQAQTNADVRALGADISDLTAMKGDLNLLDAASARADIPGVGPVDARTPGFLQSQEAVDVRQASRGIVSRLLKAQSGSTVSEQELDRKLEELGMGDNATEQQFRRGLARLMREVAAEVATREARHTPDAVKAYQERGGLTSGDMPSPTKAKRVRPTPASSALHKDASGQPTLEVPPPPKAGKVRVREKATGRMKDLAPDVAAKVLADPAYERVTQ